MIHAPEAKERERGVMQARAQLTAESPSDLSIAAAVEVEVTSSEAANLIPNCIYSVVD